MTVDFDLASYEAGNAARSLNEFDIKLNADTDRCLRRLNDLKANPPQPLPHNAVAELVADAAKPAVIGAAVAAHVGQNHRIIQHDVALNISGRRVLDALLADRDRIHAALAVIANEVIDRLHRAAAVDESIAELAKQRRNDEATVLACIDSDAETLRRLFVIRDEYLTPASEKWSTGWWSCATYSNPWELKNSSPREETVWEVIRAEIRAGGQLWFPTIAEARAASQAREPRPSDSLLPPIDPYHRTATFTG
jgi:hypothetical protein